MQTLIACCWPWCEIAPVYFVDKRVVTGVILASDRPATDGDVCHTHLYAGEPVPFPFHAVAMVLITSGYLLYQNGSKQNLII